MLQCFRQDPRWLLLSECQCEKCIYFVCFFVGDPLISISWTRFIKSAEDNFMIFLWLAVAWRWANEQRILRFLAHSRSKMVEHLPIGSFPSLEQWLVSFHRTSSWWKRDAKISCDLSNWRQQHPSAPSPTLLCFLVSDPMYIVLTFFHFSNQNQFSYWRYSTIHSKKLTYTTAHSGRLVQNTSPTLCHWFVIWKTGRLVEVEDFQTCWIFHLGAAYQMQLWNLMFKYLYTFTVSQMIHNLKDICCSNGVKTLK